MVLSVGTVRHNPTPPKLFFNRFGLRMGTGNAAAMDPGSPLKGFAFAIDTRQHVATGLGVILQVGFVSDVLRYCPGSYRV